MTWQNRLWALENFLKPYEPIWNREIIHQYPNHLNPYPTAWLEQVVSLDELQLFELCQKKTSNLGAPLGELFAEIESLTTFPQAPFSEPVPTSSHAWMGIKEKKKHEIECLLRFLKKYPTDEVLDICGGQGHLSSILARSGGTKGSCLDFDSELIERGKQRNNKLEKNGYPQVKFFHSDLRNREQSFPYFNTHHSSLGLHTCGDLANRHLSMAGQAGHKWIMSIGCCYHRLQHFPKNLAEYSEVVAMMNHQALTLATRAHIETSLEEFQLQRRVKDYRYAIHIWFYEECHQREFINLGNTPTKIYRQDFESYCQYQINRLGEKFHPYRNFNFNQFFQSQRIQSLLKDLFAATLIRFFFGRPLEATILVDRALKMEKLDYNTQLFQIFDEKLSPRNIALWAFR